MAARLIFITMIGRVVPQSRSKLAGMLLVDLLTNLEIKDCFEMLRCE